MFSNCPSILISGITAMTWSQKKKSDRNVDNVDVITYITYIT